MLRVMLLSVHLNKEESLRIDYNSKFGMDIVLNVSPRSILLSRLLSTKYKYNLLASLRSASNL